MKAYVVGTCDTKGAELAYVRDLIAAAGVPTVLVDLGTQERWRSDADVAPQEVAAHHPEGAAARARRRPRPGDRGDGRGVRALRPEPGRHRRHDRRSAARAARR